MCKGAGLTKKLQVLLETVLALLDTGDAKRL